MKIGPLVPARCREKGTKEEKKLRTSTIGQRLVEEEEEEEEALLAAPDVHIYHPPLLPGQTSGLTGRVQRDLTHPRFPSRAPEELRFAGAARYLLSPQETRESLTWQLPREITDLTKDLHPARRLSQVHDASLVTYLRDMSEQDCSRSVSRLRELDTWQLCKCRVPVQLTWLVCTRIMFNIRLTLRNIRNIAS